MYKFFLTTSLLALLSVTACDSSTKTNESKAPESKASAQDASKNLSNPTPNLETPDELKEEKIENFKEKEIKDIERIILNMLKRDPQKFMETAQMAAQFQQAKQELEVRGLLDANKDKLLSTDNALVLGNNKGTVTFILIADPLCPNCRVLESILHNVSKKNPALKTILHQWAFVNGGSDSSLIARYMKALYTADQKKFDIFYKAFLMLQEAPSENKIDKLHGLIKGAGFDVEKIKAVAESETAKAKIEETRNLAKSLKLPGAPILMALTPEGQLGIIPLGGSEEDIAKIVTELSKAMAGSPAIKPETSKEKAAPAA